MRITRGFLRVVAALTAGVILAAGAGARPPISMAQRLPAVNAPEFPEGLEWLNTSRPLTIRELRGKVVLLDFWTYCCINCIHVMPDLARLEKKYGDALVVVGVHSAKFPTEKGTENIRQAILRYGISHPVVNDANFEVWDAYTARAWPTLVLVDTRGKVVGQRSGEGVFDAFDEPIGRLVAEAKAAGTLDTRPLDLTLERDTAPRSLLSFPGKVLADAASKRLFISDSNHGRVVVTTLDGKVLDVVGAGTPGLVDGPFDRARLANPQGLALDGEVLYVADTDNHAIRRVDLAKRTVETIAGTGEQARALYTSGVGTKVPLNSPWDLLLHDGTLYIAMAGSHQIWRMDPKTLKVEPHAGSGYENRIDGPLGEAALAQPSGLATDGKRLFVADSEVSAIRAVDFDPKGAVATVVGLALFTFGDRDGVGDDVRLQHPLGVAVHSGALYVADTYNNKIKRIDPAKRAARTFVGTGEGGYADGPGRAARFDEPGGLSVAAGRLYVADTNNHAIRVVDLEKGAVSTLRLDGAERLTPPMRDGYSGKVVTLAPQAVAPGSGEVVLDVALAPGLEPSDDAPFSFELRSSDEKAIVISAAPVAGGMTLSRRFPYEAKPGEATLTLDAVLYYCESTRKSLCFLERVRFVIPVRVESGAGSSLRVGYAIERAR
jgi:sugar lactone lactonase YvrE